LNKKGPDGDMESNYEMKIKDKKSIKKYAAMNFTVASRGVSFN
jgi:hypothetical protein